MKSLKPAILLAIVIMIARTSDAQNDSSEAFAFSIRQLANQDDYTLGFSFSTPTRSKKLSWFVSFDARPYRRKVRVKQSNNLFFQYAEDRYLVGIGGAYQRDLVNGFGVYLQLSTHYTWGRYSGTKTQPPNGVLFIPDIGLFLRARDAFTFKLGYAFQGTIAELRRVTTSSPKRFAITITMDL